MGMPGLEQWGLRTPTGRMGLADQVLESLFAPRTRCIDGIVPRGRHHHPIQDDILLPRGHFDSGRAETQAMEDCLQAFFSSSRNPIQDVKRWWTGLCTPYLGMQTG